jgi:hypothetical protein
MPTIEFDAKNEWDSVYSGTRVSIEAVAEAQIRKNGKGPKKKIWTSSSEISGPGPYYDPKSCHVHIWKKGKDIENFTCEQNKSKDYCQITESDLNRLYCRICHIKLKFDKFDKFNLEDEKSRFNIDYPKLNHTECTEITPTGYSVFNESELIEQKRNEIEKNIIIQEKESESDLIIKIKRVNDRWYNVIYKLTQPRILYNISKLYSKLIWPWEMTPYQKFKYSNPNYRDSFIFIKSKLEDFQENYVCIE